MKKTPKVHQELVREPRAVRKAHPERRRAKALKKGRGPKKKLHPGGPPFGREFFESVLPEMVARCPRADDEHIPIVRVHLGDGTDLDVAGVVALFDRYGVLAAYEGTGEDGIEHTADDVGMEAFSYDMVLRVSVRASARRQHRLGFAPSYAGSKKETAGGA